MSSTVQKIQTENGWHVNLVGANNQIVFTTEVYEDEQAAEKAVEWIRKFAYDDADGRVTIITKRL